MKMSPKNCFFRGLFAENNSLLLTLRETTVMLIKEVKNIHDALEKSVNNNIREMGLTFSQASVLRTLSNDSSCQMSMKELEKALHVAQSTTVRIVQNMERNGLVDSFGDVSDKRVKYIRLTEKGKTLNKVAQQKKDADEAAMYSGFSVEEKQMFLSMLERIKNNMMH